MNINSLYNNLYNDIDQKYLDFEEVWENGDKEILKELIFCICTPQSKAQSGWKAVLELDRQNLIDQPNQEKIAQVLSDSGVRFKNRKASYIIEVLNRFNHKSISIKDFIYSNITKYGDYETRNWFAKNVKGIGMKEASHFLRNIGHGQNLAILDRHILRKLDEHAGIKQPKNLNNGIYIEIEKDMLKYTKEVNIPMFALDFVFWAETHKGELFK